MSIWNTPEREELRKTVRSFTEREILPHADEWERAGELPRELHRRAGAAGLLGANFPEAVGGAAGTASTRSSSAKRCTNPVRPQGFSRRCSPAASRCRT